MNSLFPVAGKHRLIYWILAPVLGVFSYFGPLSNMTSDARLLASLAVSLVLVAFGQARYNTYTKAEHNRLLDILYKQQNPEGFLSAYLPLAKRCRQDTYQYVVINYYISSAYSAMGEFAKAREVLVGVDANRLKRNRTLAKGMLYNGLANACLFDKDIPGAENAIAALKDLVAKTRQSAPRLSDTLEDNLTRYEGHLQYLKGEPVQEIGYFIIEYEQADNLIHKGNIGLLLGWFYLAQSQKASDKASASVDKTLAENVLKEVAYGKKVLYSTRMAEQALKQMEEEN